MDASALTAVAEDDLRVGNRLLLIEGLHATGYAAGGSAYFCFIAAREAFRRTCGFPQRTGCRPSRRGSSPPGRRTLFDGRYEFSLEGYWKGMRKLVENQNGAAFPGLNQDWQNKVASGPVQAHGAEVFLGKHRGSTTTWLGYALAWSNRTFDNLSGGRAFPYRHDRRHDFSLVLLHMVRPGIEITGLRTVALGNAVMLEKTVYRVNPYLGICTECTVTTFSERIGYRMRAYHRMDIGVDFRKRTDSRERTLSAGLYNAYNRKNPLFVAFDTEGGRMVLKPYSLIPILPFVTSRLKY